MYPDTYFTPLEETWEGWLPTTMSSTSFDFKKRERAINDFNRIQRLREAQVAAAKRIQRWWRLILYSRSASEALQAAKIAKRAILRRQRKMRGRLRRGTVLLPPVAPRGVKGSTELKKRIASLPKVPYKPTKAELMKFKAEEKKRQEIEKKRLRTLDYVIDTIDGEIKDKKMKPPGGKPPTKDAKEAAKAVTKEQTFATKDATKEVKKGITFATKDATKEVKKEEVKEVIREVMLSTPRKEKPEVEAPRKSVYKREWTKPLEFGVKESWELIPAVIMHSPNSKMGTYAERVVTREKRDTIKRTGDISKKFKNVLLPSTLETKESEKATITLEFNKKN